MFIIIFNYLTYFNTKTFSSDLITAVSSIKKPILLLISISIKKLTWLIKTQLILVYFYKLLGSFAMPKLLNQVLFKKMAFIHPIFLISSLLILTQCTILKQTQVYTYLKVIVVLITLLTGLWWAGQEVLWGGFWNWDFTEFSLIWITIIFIIQLHKKNSYFNQTSPELLLMLILSNHCIFFKSIHQFSNNGFLKLTILWITPFILFKPNTYLYLYLIMGVFSLKITIKTLIIFIKKISYLCLLEFNFLLLFNTVFIINIRFFITLLIKNTNTYHIIINFLFLISTATVLLKSSLFYYFNKYHIYFNKYHTYLYELKIKKTLYLLNLYHYYLIMFPIKKTPITYSGFQYTLYYKLETYLKNPKQVLLKKNTIYTEFEISKVNKFFILNKKTSYLFFKFGSGTWFKQLQSIFFWTNQSRIVYTSLFHQFSYYKNFVLLIKGKLHLKGSVKKRFLKKSSGVYSNNGIKKKNFNFNFYLYHKTGLSNCKLRINFKWI